MIHVDKEDIEFEGSGASLIGEFLALYLDLRKAFVENEEGYMFFGIILPVIRNDLERNGYLDEKQ